MKKFYYNITISPLSLQARINNPEYKVRVSDQEQAELIRAAKVKRRRAIEKLFTAQASPIVAMAYRFAHWGRKYGIELDDLIAEGVVAFYEAIEKYSSKKGGTPFGAYFLVRLRLHIIAFIVQNRSPIRGPINHKGLDEFSILAAANALAIQSLEYLQEASPDIDWPAPSSPAIPVATLVKPKDRIVRFSLDALAPARAELVRAYFGFNGPPESQVEIARRLNVSANSVGHSIKAARKKLRVLLMGKVALRTTESEESFEEALQDEGVVYG